MAGNSSVGTSRDTIGPLTDIARALKEWSQTSRSGALQGPTGATGATGATGPTGPQGPQGDPAPVVDWYADAAWRSPSLITNSRGIELLWDAGLELVTIQTNFAVPAGPVADWYGTDATWHFPSHVSTSRGIEFIWDSGTDSIIIQTNFEVWNIARNPIFTQDGDHRTHSLHAEYVAPLGGTSSFSFTEATWKADANVPMANPGQLACGNASVTVQLIGRDATTGDAFDRTYKTTLFRVYDPSAGTGDWAIHQNSVLMTGMSLGTGTVVTTWVALSGASDGTITVNVSNPLSAGTVADCAVIIDIRGAGWYGT